VLPRGADGGEQEGSEVTDGMDDVEKAADGGSESKADTDLQIDSAISAERPVTQPPKCQICLDEPQQPFELPCHHSFCTACLGSYIESKVVNGQTDISCIYISNDSPKPCAEAVTEQIVSDVLGTGGDHGLTILLKYERFRYMDKHSNARECPKCGFMQLGSDAERRMTCSGCNCVYCYVHSGAHPDITCEQYEASIQTETDATNITLKQISKPCPGCGLHVAKSGGCNHMKVSLLLTYMHLLHLLFTVY
jgi:hypothetical protein